MQRILIIGSAGAGKSTLSKKLGAILHIPVIHLDKYYWKPNWVASESLEWEQFVEEQTAQEAWIMDGNYSRTLKMRLEKADAVIFLDMPRALCIYRVIKRRIQYNGLTRSDMNEGCPEQLDWEFIRWIWNFKKRSRTKLVNALREADGEKQVIILDSRTKIRMFLVQLSRGEFDL